MTCVIDEFNRNQIFFRDKFCQLWFSFSNNILDQWLQPSLVSSYKTYIFSSNGLNVKERIVIMLSYYLTWAVHSVTDGLHLKETHWFFNNFLRCPPETRNSVDHFFNSANLVTFTCLIPNTRCLFYLLLYGIEWLLFQLPDSSVKFASFSWCGFTFGCGQFYNGRNAVWKKQSSVRWSFWTFMKFKISITYYYLGGSGTLCVYRENCGCWFGRNWKVVRLQAGWEFNLLFTINWVKQNRQHWFETDDLNNTGGYRWLAIKMTTGVSWQIRAGIAHVLIDPDHMVATKERIQNSSSVYFRPTGINGLVSYVSRNWDVFDNRLRGW